MDRRSVLKAVAFSLLGVLMVAPSLANTEAKASSIDKINQRGVLRVGMSTFVPWAMRDKQGELIGFEIDVANKLAQDNGWKVEFIPTAWDGIIPALLANKFDVIIGGLSITPEREKSVLFSDAYAHSGVQIAVNKNRKPDVKTFDDLNSRRTVIAARRGASTIAVARAIFPKARLLQFDDDAQAFQEVLNGNADAAIASTPKPEQEAIKNPTLLYLPFPERLSQGDEAFAVRLGEQDKTEFFNKWIAARTADGWLKTRYDYWFSTLDWEGKVAQGQ